MALTDHPDDIQAFLTDQARQYLARMLIGELSYQLVGFSVGRGGYEPLDPVKIQPIVRSDTALQDPVYPDAIGGYAAFASIETPTTGTPVLNCRLSSSTVQSEADYALGEIGIWAQILSSSNPPPATGDVFLFAIGHFPIRAKTRRDVFLFRVVTSL